MQVDIAASNSNKRKQNSIELTTLISDNTQMSTLTSLAGSQEEMQGTDGQ